MRDSRLRRLFISILIIGILAIGIYEIKKRIGPVALPPIGTVQYQATPTNQNPTGDPLIDKLTIQSGFSMEVFAKELKGARDIIFDNKGNMLVSQTSEGKISLIQKNSQKTLISGLSKPHGMAILCKEESCALFVAQHSKLTSYDYDDVIGSISNEKKLIDIPAVATDRHFTRSLLLLPDNQTLLISVGSSCDVCNEQGQMKGRIMAYNISTGKVSEYARGLRNSVFMTLSPEGKVFATEMGRDGLGDNIPPDEINIIEAGKNYGWPNCYGKNIHDNIFDKNIYIRNPCSEPFETPSIIDLQAHSAPLGLAFVTSLKWPKEFNNNLLVAYHGSWNSSVPTGYKVVRNILDEQGNFVETKDFITGWLNSNGEKIGRPVDIIFDNDGNAFISDDQNGFIYKVTSLRSN